MRKNDNHIISEAVNSMNKVNCCPVCGNDKLSYQVTKELIPKKLTAFETIILLLIPFIGWIILATSHNKKVIGNATYAICNRCGNTWAIKVDKDKPSTIRRLLPIIFLVLLLILLGKLLFMYLMSNHLIFS